ncbi:TIM barrel protein [Candidatus Omnitrophota bacterium]
MKFGLKLWSDNKSYVEPAKELYKEGAFDFIELYTVPDTPEKLLKTWKDLNIEFIVHAPHYSHGFNLADPEKSDANIRLFDKARLFADELDAKYIIVHPGILGSHEAVIEQIKSFEDKRILVENKPYRALNMEICAGHDPESIKDIIVSCDVGLCLDIAHAANYAVNRGKGIIDTLDDFIDIRPKMLHVCGVDLSVEVDKHLHMKESDIDLGTIKQQLLNSGIEYFTLETPKDSEESLEDFRGDICLLKKILGIGHE